MTMLVHMLYLICNALLIPVVVALLGSLGWVLVLCGGFIRESLGRARSRRSFSVCVELAKQCAQSEMIWAALQRVDLGLPICFYRQIKPEQRSDRTVLLHALAELEHTITAHVARLSLLTRVGPMLGLMGTLIPLGPVLMGLSAGNLQDMAQNLIMAFATTVVGILIGALAYAISLLRRAWYARDMSDLEFVVHRLFTEKPHEKA